MLLGKYRVDAILGHGGMGVVTKCTHLGLNDPVAMKMLRQDVLLDRDATERFMREAQAASKLRSEHVARVVDVGTFDDTGVPYMVMEFLDGHDLGELLEQRGAIPASWASMLILQAAEALAEAHSIGIVHRDVKPSNLFVTWRPDGSAILKVLDFGISKSPMGTDMKLTQTQSLLGTPAYMSPEQMRSARLVDARTDIWSLGIVFYELLEGHRPFEAESFSEMCVKVAVDSPAPMKNAPPALQQVVMRCLAKSPEQRYANMAELGRDLLPFVQEQHQAQLLVERMARMQGRRSAIEASGGGAWHGETPQGTPQPWHPDSNPVATPAPWSSEAVRRQTPATGISQITLPDQPRGRAASEITNHPPRRRWLALVLAALVAGGGLAVGLYLGRPGASEPVVETPKPTLIKETAIAVDPPKVAPKPEPPVTPPPSDVKPTAGGSAATVVDPTKVPKDDAKIVVVDPTPPKKQPPPWKRPPPKKDPPKKDPQVQKDPPKKDPPKNDCPPLKRLPSGKCSDV